MPAMRGLLSIAAWLAWVCGTAAIAPIPLTPAALAQTSESDLRSWSYNPALGRLDITIARESRPLLFTLENPSRVVLDFPNINWGRPELIEQYQGRVRSLRISQFSPDVTRIILDIDPEQPISNRELQLLTASPDRWAVQLLNPPQFTLSQTPIAPTPAPTPPPTPAPEVTLPPPPPSPPSSPPISAPNRRGNNRPNRRNPAPRPRSNPHPRT